MTEMLRDAAAVDVCARTADHARGPFLRADACVGWVLTMQQADGIARLQLARRIAAGMRWKSSEEQQEVCRTHSAGAVGSWAARAHHALASPRTQFLLDLLASLVPLRGGRHSSVIVGLRYARRRQDAARAGPCTDARSQLRALRSVPLCAAGGRTCSHLPPACRRTTRGRGPQPAAWAVVTSRVAGEDRRARWAACTVRRGTYHRAAGASPDAEAEP